MKASEIVNHVSKTVNLRKIIDRRNASLGELSYHGKLSTGNHAFKTIRGVFHIVSVEELKKYCIIL